MLISKKLHIVFLFLRSNHDMKKIGIGKIQRIQFDKLQKDFSFIVNGKIYKTNSFVANILSTNISNKFSDEISYYEMKVTLIELLNMVK